MNSNNYIQADKFDFKLFLLLSAILLISPIVGFFLSILFFRQKASAIIFILFSFYFGWFYEPQLDLLNHYNHFKYLVGKSLFQQWTDIGTLGIGKEPYPVIFKYIVGLISVSPNFFSACACCVYTIIFVYGVLGSLKDLYRSKMKFASLLIFIGIIFVVEYNWFTGFRFWSGVFVFASFYIRYIRTNQTKYLLLSCLCLCFHFSLIVLCIAVFFNHFLKERFTLRYILLALSFIPRILNIPLTAIIAKMSIFSGIVKPVYSNDRVMESIIEGSEKFRSIGNQFYLLRNEILLIGIIPVLILLKKISDTEFIKKNNELWGLSITMLTIANCGYTERVFYDRFFKIGLLLTYIFTYIWIMHLQNKLKQDLRIKIIAFSILPILYGIATIVVSQREFLWRIELWFNNFFF